MNNHVFTGVPVDRSSNTVFVGSLERVDYSEKFSCITTGRGGVRENESDSLLRVDDED
jgi:hypothetical protein